MGKRSGRRVNNKSATETESLRETFESGYVGGYSVIKSRLDGGS